MPLPDRLTIRTALSSPSSEQLCEAYLDHYGLLQVCGEWYEVVHVDVSLESEHWTWTLRKRDAGAA